MSKVIELFGHPTGQISLDWQNIVSEQACPFLGRKCYKVRKSSPNVSIGTCTVLPGRSLEPIVICPARLTERRQVFTDCLHLLTTHEPGNELHVVSEVSIPGGSVDYFLISVKNGKVKDFVGIELQAVDTTGTVWPERQRFLNQLGLEQDDYEDVEKPYGMNWKMSAKTILIQIHHKIRTFEHVNKKLVLVIQDKLLAYMEKEFNFAHLNNPAGLGDSMHFHSYRLNAEPDSLYKLVLQSRLSTDADGIGICLGLQAEARVELEKIVESLEAKISGSTLFAPA